MPPVDVLRATRPLIPGTPGAVWLGSADPVIDVFATLRRPVSSPLPRPKIETVDRHGLYGLTQYLGQDPYQLLLPIAFDRYAQGQSVEPEIRLLERLAERPAGATEPPLVEVDGPVPHRTLQWRIAGLEEIPERTEWNRAGDRTRLAVDVTLVQNVTDRLLTESLGRDRAKTKGIANRRTTVRTGEDSLYDVARRVYGDPSRAGDIARANSVRGVPLRLGMRLKPGYGLRLPS
jgi:hypothetical protein